MLKRHDLLGERECQCDRARVCECCVWEREFACAPAVVAMVAWEDEGVPGLVIVPGVVCCDLWHVRVWV